MGQSYTYYICECTVVHDSLFKLQSISSHHFEHYVCTNPGKYVVVKMDNGKIEITNANIRVQFSGSVISIHNTEVTIVDKVITNTTHPMLTHVLNELPIKSNTSVNDRFTCEFKDGCLWVVY